MKGVHSLSSIYRRSVSQSPSVRPTLDTNVPQASRGGAARTGSEERISRRSAPLNLLLMPLPPGALAVRMDYSATRPRMQGDRPFQGTAGRGHDAVVDPQAHRRGGGRRPCPRCSSDGTFYFNNEPNLFDQFLVNKNMAKQTAPVRAKAETVEILRFPNTFTGKYKRPRPFGGMGKPVDEDGFSDHFPIGMQVAESD
jgi:hypothetical protein